MSKTRGFRQMHYASVNKRLRILEGSSFVTQIGFKETKAGFQATIYQLTGRAYLAILFNGINLDDLLSRMNEDNSDLLLGVLLHII